MALATPRPFATKSGSYYLNVRVPKELREVARGRPVTLPINGESVTVSVTDKVFVSLRTKSAREARDRSQIVLNRLAASRGSRRAKPSWLLPESGGRPRRLASRRRRRRGFSTRRRPDYRRPSSSSSGSVVQDRCRCAAVSISTKAVTLGGRNRAAG